MATLKLKVVDVGIDDPDMSLDEWLFVVNTLIEQHGSGAYMHTDAGHNNVSFFVTKEIKEKV